MRRLGIGGKFIISSVLWLAVGSLAAVYFVLGRNVFGAAPELRFVHSHSMLIGFVSMMIFGVAYRMLPMPPLLGTRRIYSADLARYHLYLANGALVGMAASSIWTYFFEGDLSLFAIAFFSLLQVGGMFLFVYNVYMTASLGSPVPGGGDSREQG